MSLEIAHPPRMTRAAFILTLERAHSPAAQEAGACYDAIAQVGIDPAVALAFFQHESSFGRQGVAAQTRSWGNRRHPDGSWMTFPNWAASAADWAAYMQRRYVQRGLTTVAQIIPVYAPSSDGNTPDRYIQAVENAVTRWASVGYRVKSWATAGAIVRTEPRTTSPQRGKLLPQAGSQFSGQLVPGEHVALPGFGESDQWLRLSTTGGYIWSGLVEEVVS